MTTTPSTTSNSDLREAIGLLVMAVTPLAAVIVGVAAMNVLSFEAQLMCRAAKWTDRPTVVASQADQPIRQRLLQR